MKQLIEGKIMNLYPEMNEKIKDILRTGEAHCLYAAARIEELESQLETIRNAAEAICKAWNSESPDAILGDRINEMQDLLS